MDLPSVVYCKFRRKIVDMSLQGIFEFVTALVHFSFHTLVVGMIFIVRFFKGIDIFTPFLARFTPFRRSNCRVTEALYMSQLVI